MPKICGNTRQYHLTALLAALLAVACGEGSGPEQIREIRAHWLPGCGPEGEAGAARIDLEALGDFEPSPDTFEQFDADVVQARSVFPPDTRAVLLEADDGFDRWHGLAPTERPGDVDIALWPVASGCTVFEGEAGRFPESGEGTAVGFAPSTSTLLLAGGTGESASSAMTIDLGTGATREVPDGPRTARSFATITRFGSDLLVAGGVDPETNVPLDSADVFRAALGRFDATRLPLSRPRHRHAAVELASGETLILGGDDGNGGALRALESLSPETGEYRISGLARLSRGRIDPVAVRLSNGEVLVAGGTDVTGEPVALLEWLDPTASDVVRSMELTGISRPTRDRAFAAMPGGGALAAGGCELRLPAVDEAALCEHECGTGGGCASRDVLWILPGGDVVLLDGALDAGASAPSLVEGAGGHPWLVAGTPAAPVVRVFDPFLARFDTPDGSPISPTEAARLTLVTADPGLYLWFGRGASQAFVGGFRHGVRGPYSRTTEPLLVRNQDGVAPDRPIAGPPSAGGITLVDPELRLVLTDTTYGSLRLTLEIESGPPPIVYLGERSYGDDTCPWPATEERGPATVIRHAAGVRLQHGGEARECEGPDGRVAVSLRAREEVTLTSMSVQRSGE